MLESLLSTNYLSNLGINTFLLLASTLETRIAPPGRRDPVPIHGRYLEHLYVGSYTDINYLGRGGREHNVRA